MLKNHNISIPFPEPRPGDGVRYTLGYEKPANINVVGSYVRKTDSRTDDPMVIDMAITMPSVCIPMPSLCHHLVDTNMSIRLYFKKKTI